MANPTNLMSLPRELQEEIVGNLELRDRVCLKVTCNYYNHIIPSLNLEQLLEAEKYVSCEQRDLFACRYCLRLRDGTEFTEKLLAKGKSRGHKDAAKRFCIDCGLNAPEGTTRYSPGAATSVMGVTKVICVWCNSVKPIGDDIEGKKVQACVDCQGEREDVLMLRKFARIRGDVGRAMM
ncbi:MAG: hypothetical protein Q9169_007798 [Polycauliona sp. 2 TL-2023]